MDPHTRAGAVLGPGDAELVEHATLSLGRLDGLAMLLPDAKLHAWLAVRKEAVLSSHLDDVGPKVSVTDVLRHQDGAGAGPEGVAEVAALADGLDLGLSRLRGGSVLSAELLREMDAVLRPGTAASTGLADLDLLLRGPPPVLVRLGLALARIEELRPFDERSGRLARALAPMLLFGEGVLQVPLLYPSIFFRPHREVYRRRLRALRDGDAHGWVRFVLEALASAAVDAAATVRGLLVLFETDRGSVVRSASPIDGLRIYEALKRHPIATVDRLAELAGLSPEAALTAVTVLERQRIVREREGGLFAYTAYVDVLDEGTVLRQPTR